MKNLLPKETWALLQQQPDALFVDVRMEIEARYVGYPPGAVNIPWYEFPAMKADAASFEEVRAAWRQAVRNTQSPPWSNWPTPCSRMPSGPAV